MWIHLFWKLYAFNAFRITLVFLKHFLIVTKLLAL